MIEVWKPIEGFEGYEVSEQGRVRCWRAKGFAPPPPDPRIVKPRRGTNGYLNVILGYKGPTKMIHRLVAEAFVEGQEDGLQVAHENGVKTDNRATNLSWKTMVDNQRDKLVHGTNGKTLTMELVQGIREAYQPGVTTQEQVAAKFGITQAAVSKIIREQRWKVVT